MRICFFLAAAVGLFAEDTFCPFYFEAAAHQGPNAGKFNINGKLQIESGKANGNHNAILTMTLDDRSTVDVAVKATMQGAMIAFEVPVGSGARLIGNGFVVRSNTDSGCISFDGGGLFAGPDDVDGDTGSWSVSFYNNPGPGGSSSTNSPPVARNIGFNSAGRVTMDAAGSFIQAGATVKVQIPFTTTVVGTYPLQSDVTGTKFVGVYDANSVQPAGTCRVFVVTNPNGTASNTATGCR